MSKNKNKILIDPRFALEIRDLEDFLAEFGPFNGRYVPRFPTDWPKRLREHLEELAIERLHPVKKQSLLEKLRRELNLCTEPVNWEWQEEKTWKQNIQHQSRRADNALVIGDGIDPAPFASWEETIDQIRGTRRRSWPFHGTVSEYIAACRPLLLNSPAAYLIDCYLDPLSEVAESLVRSLLSLINGSRCFSIEIITRRSACGLRTRNFDDIPINDEELADRMNKIYMPFIPRERQIVLNIVEEGRFGSDSLKLHDRFFLTIHGSINFGQGFLLVNQKLPQQNAFITDKEHHQHLKDTFIEGVANFHRLSKRKSQIAYPLSVTKIHIANIH